MIHSDLFDRLVETLKNATHDETSNALIYSYGALSAHLGSTHADAVFATILDAFDRDALNANPSYDMRATLNARFGEVRRSA